MKILNLYLAYAVVWAIHGGYLLFLAVKYVRLNGELKKLEGNKKEEAGSTK